jgi:hypothetical protein
VEFRPLQDPGLPVEYGIAWLEPSVSPIVPQFVEVGRELASL